LGKRILVKSLKWIYLGRNCNYNCLHCRYRKNAELIRKTDDILAEIRDAKGEGQGVFINGGDIFEHPGWKEILKELSKHDNTTMIYTNASHAVFEDKARALAESVDYIVAYVPAHFSYAQTIITGVQGSYLAEEAGLINIRNADAKVVIKTPITRFVADEPHNYINWAGETLGDAAIGAWVEFPELNNQRLNKLKNGPGMSTRIFETYNVRLVNGELFANLLLQEFGKQVAVAENIPPCIIRDIDAVEFLWTGSEYVKEPICGLCKLRTVCKGILKSYKERVKHSRELHPILVDVPVR